ncbi:MAG: branched-chain amino acid ABC transporter permease [Aminobacterium sp.]|uniref:branched-chain amino acid ABC transporter permease n=1 Tax=unclassified Aminobacterium TaxID=2685012 RepID=UPI001BCF6EFC|nr:MULTISPECIES: branched-chain amino acid ABC transporter permease [unclassified Aminobacterium]MDD2207239.1 branched-chain amino acid ABC transporter permease [Aminobacterium sp.]MDD3426028.1 branched-chain amino acid ABC transporter permease [Aminobacterium sp.]MDD3707231.1 branched-chain amino acid ABC transporter permease [Aminobacterium sp.]MDD4229081.1 branched-chain amino acid ABC transporter permease [Aminobacterium sp.]MDD4551927.1 branched-chain amino acid ABC transporter permease [
MATFLQQVINGLSLGSVYALIAVGYSLVYSILLFSNFAHGGFLVIGGYICYVALKTMGLNIWMASLLSLVGAGIAAVLTERIAYKPIRERTNVTLYLLIASMGMSIVIENIFVIVAGGRFRALPPVIPTHPVQIFNIATTSAFDLLSFVVALVALGCLQLFLSRTKWGLAIRAAACDLRTAGLMGVNVNLLIAIVFFTAGALAAIGGIFLSVRYTLYPQLGVITIKAFVAAVIGGLGSLPGAVVGSLILGLAEMLAAGFISSQMRDLVVFSLLVITLLIKPTGLFGKQMSEKI